MLTDRTPWGEPGAKLLILADGRRAGAFRARLPDATVLTSVDSLDGMEARFDAAVVVGLLEHAPWDRWVLQRVHRALRMHAPITVIVPPLASLASAIDFPFLAYAAWQLLLRSVKRCRPGFERLGPVRRRYRFCRLLRDMQSVGFTAFQAGPGWHAGRALLMARKASSLSGVDGRAWPEVPVRRKQYLGQIPGELDPREWRDARVIVLAPHPDDELIGCGGTLCRLLSSGARVWIVQATDGSRLESLCDLPGARRKTIRLDEARRVASALGAELILWREEDARLRCSSSTILRLACLLDELRPTHVFTPFFGDRHADHRTLSHVLRNALARVRVAPQVLQYEVWGRVPANLYCDITGQMQAVERLLCLYERAMRVEDFVHFCERRNFARALEFTGRPGYAEAFLCTPSGDFRRRGSTSPAPDTELCPQPHVLT